MVMSPEMQEAIASDILDVGSLVFPYYKNRVRWQINPADSPYFDSEDGEYRTYHNRPRCACPDHERHRASGYTDVLDYPAFYVGSQLQDGQGALACAIRL